MTDTPDFSVKWMDAGREPQCPSDPAYPDGIDLVGALPDQPSCLVKVPYPAQRCGAYALRCRRCGLCMMLTTAGRRDDPRSVTVNCRAIQ